MEEGKEAAKAAVKRRKKRLGRCNENWEAEIENYHPEVTTINENEVVSPVVVIFLGEEGSGKTTYVTCMFLF